MNCKHCAKKITEALNKAGISAFEIDFEVKKITAHISDEEAEKVISVIEEAGYMTRLGIEN